MIATSISFSSYSKRQNKKRFLKNKVLAGQGRTKSSFKFPRIIGSEKWEQITSGYKDYRKLQIPFDILYRKNLTNHLEAI